MAACTNEGGICGNCSNTGLGGFLKQLASTERCTTSGLQSTPSGQLHSRIEIVRNHATSIHSNSIRNDNNNNNNRNKSNNNNNFVGNRPKLDCDKPSDRTALKFL